MARKALKSGLRFDVFNRDGFTCQYCGKRPPEVVLHCDHIVPVVKGGTTELDNLATSCSQCNRGKHAKDLNKGSINWAVKTEYVKEQAAQLKQYRKYMKTILSVRAEEEGVVFDAWGNVLILSELMKNNLRGALRSSPLHLILSAIDITAAKFPYEKVERDFTRLNTIKYFRAVLRNLMTDAKP